MKRFKDRIAWIIPVWVVILILCIISVSGRHSMQSSMRSVDSNENQKVEKKVHVKAGEWKRVKRSELKSFDLVPMLKLRPVGGKEIIVTSQDTVIPSDVVEIDFQSEKSDFAITLLVSK